MQKPKNISGMVSDWQLQGKINTENIMRDLGQISDKYNNNEFQKILDEKMDELNKGK